MCSPRRPGLLPDSVDGTVARLSHNGHRCNCQCVCCLAVDVYLAVHVGTLSITVDVIVPGECATDCADLKSIDIRACS